MKCIGSRQVTVVMFALLMTSCAGFQVHDSARPLGKGALEVGFSAARMTVIPVGNLEETGGLAGGGIGYLRYGASDKTDVTFLTSGAGLGGHVDQTLVASNTFNLSLGAGLGIEHYAAELDERVLAFAPDVTLLASFGEEGHELTTGLKAFPMFMGTIEGFEFDSAGAAVGVVVNYRHQGKRLVITPEMGIFFGMGDLLEDSLIIMPSVSFALLR